MTNPPSSENNKYAGREHVHIPQIRITKEQTRQILQMSQRDKNEINAQFRPCSKGRGALACTLGLQRHTWYPHLLWRDCVNIDREFVHGAHSIQSSATEALFGSIQYCKSVHIPLNWIFVSILT